MSHQSVPLPSIRDIFPGMPLLKSIYSLLTLHPEISIRTSQDNDTSVSLSLPTSHPSVLIISTRIIFAPLLATAVQSPIVRVIPQFAVFHHHHHRVQAQTRLQIDCPISPQTIPNLPQPIPSTFSELTLSLPPFSISLLAPSCVLVQQTPLRENRARESPMDRLRFSAFLWLPSYLLGSHNNAKSTGPRALFTVHKFHAIPYLVHPNTFKILDPSLHLPYCPFLYQTLRILLPPS